MRRFIEEIQVKDPQIAEKIIVALETRSDDRRDPIYEVEMYNKDAYDPSRKETINGYCTLLKIFVREEVVR